MAYFSQRADDTQMSCWELAMYQETLSCPGTQNWAPVPVLLHADQPVVLKKWEMSELKWAQSKSDVVVHTCALLALRSQGLVERHKFRGQPDPQSEFQNSQDYIFFKLQEFGKWRNLQENGTEHLSLK